MKKILLLGLLVLVAFWIFAKPNSTQQPMTLTPTPSTTQTQTVTVNGETMGYAYIVSKPQQVSLIPNFTQKKTSSELMEEYSCVAGINGGFYDTNDQPLGLFISHGTTLRDTVTNALINGFVGVDGNTAFISHEAPINADFALQTGPRLITSGTPHRLQLASDEHARRMIVALTTDNILVFIALYQPDSVFDGPLLADVPLYLSTINQKELLNITDAINLDGGSASSFYNTDIALGELTSIGSLFCVQ